MKLSIKRNITSVKGSKEANINTVNMPLSRINRNKWFL